MKKITIILIFFFSVRINGLSRNSSRFYNKYSNDDYDDYENEDYENLTNISDDEQESDADDMYESEKFYYRHKPVFDEKYFKHRTLKEDVIADENWPYPDEDEIGFNRTISSKYTCGKCFCGNRINVRIIGGSVTTRNRFPWMVMLALNNEFICGASLINTKYILSAAHCFAGNKVSSLTARFRVLKRLDLQIKPQAFQRKLAKYWIHSKFNPNTLNFDIALARLKKSINSFKLLNPICLPPKLGVWGGNGRNGHVSGWGDTTASSSTQVLANQLKQVEVRILTNQQCIKELDITENMICAGEVGRDSCQGDSGGPLAVAYNEPSGRWKQLGIVSWGIGCGGDTPGVYTRVPRFIKWIKTKASVGACWCRK